MASPTDAGIGLTVLLPPDQFEALAQRVAAVLAEGRDDGFLDVDGAAEYLGLSRKAVYHLVERGRLAHRKPDGRLIELTGHGDAPEHDEPPWRRAQEAAERVEQRRVRDWVASRDLPEAELAFLVDVVDTFDARLYEEAAA
jgi:excisionase family DNA binding protein